MSENYTKNNLDEVRAMLKKGNKKTVKQDIEEYNTQMKHAEKALTGWPGLKYSSLEEINFPQNVHDSQF